MTQKAGWPKSYKCRFIEPGFVYYNEYGTVLIDKPTLDAMMPSFVGKPVLDVAHMDVDPEIYANGKADGIVTKAWYNEKDGWYWAEYLVWDAETREHCNSGQFSVSCAYSADEHSEAGGTHNNLKYDQRILKGTYEHLAIVANPRYEEARIVYNSKGGNEMRLKFWKKDEKLENSSEIDLEKAVVNVDGKDVEFKDIMRVYNDSNAKLTEESTVEIDGKKVVVKDMINSYREKIKNEGEEAKKLEAEKIKNEQDEKLKKEEEVRKNAEDKEKKDKDDMKNAHEHGDHKEKMEGCTHCNSPEGIKHFESLKNANALRGEPQHIAFVDRDEQIKRGAEKYGSAKKA